jgi:hypothetical protein
MKQTELRWFINKLITYKGKAFINRSNTDYYQQVKELLNSGYSEQRARFAALPPLTYWVK